MSMPSLGGVGNSEATGSVLAMVTEFVTSKAVLSSLLISALIVILFLSLKVAGVFGK
jgi:hypothetical protein